MCDAEKDWHERSFRASGAFGSRQNLPFNKPEILFFFLYFSASRALCLKRFFTVLAHS